MTSNVSKLADSDLLTQIKALAQEERRLSLAVIEHLREVNRRRLFSDLGYPSLLAYCVRELGYSESSAYRRIQAMRLIQAVPEAKVKIENGTLSLSVAAQAQTFFKQEERAVQQAIRPEEKKAVLEKLESKSSREAERELLALSSQPEARLPDQARILTSTHTEIRFTADEALMAQLEQIKGLLAHQNPGMSWSELIQKMAEVTLEKLDPARKPCRNAIPTSKSASVSSSSGNFASDLSPTGIRKPIPAPIRREVWKRARSRCQHCGSRHALEIDHIRPVARGGNNNLRNLRLLCENCNQRAAIQTFGIRKMEAHIKT